MGLAVFLRTLFWVIAIFVAITWVRRALSKPDEKPPLTESQTLQKCGVCEQYLPKEASRCARAGCPRFVILFLLLLFSVPAEASNGGGRYLVEISGSNVASTLEINEVTVGRWQLGNSAMTGASLNHWLKEGNNRITLKATATAGRPATLTARVYFSGFNAAGGTQQVNLLTVEEFGKVGEGVTVNFNLPSTPALALWQAQAGAVLDEGVALQLVEQLRQQSLNLAKQGQGIMDAASLSMERNDMARAYGAAASPEPLALDKPIADAEVGMSPAPQPGDLQIVALGSGPIRVARRDGAPLIVIQQGSRTYQVASLLVGQVNGVWAILRRAY